ncbi:MAG: pyridoxal-phosphate dependent enzyme [Rhodobacteraceae bacterium]|nr:pyridoxal-phosphate dependent enzyme [Paracoccaceae bacterium]
MDILRNPYRGNPDALPALGDMPLPGDDPARPVALIARCPEYAPTPLRAAPGLAETAGVGALWIKDERGRMGLGSFKALGAAHVIADDAARGDARGATYVTASAGNHGLSVAAGARAFGADAVVYIAGTVPESFADRLRGQGARVVRAGATYEDSMAAAAAAADTHGWRLLSDSSWPGYAERPHRLMQGYLVLMHEIAAQIPQRPTHLFLQAGVGGLAGAVAAMARRLWGEAPGIVVVEPDAAPALAASIARGAPVHADGPVSVMGRLDCKEPSLIALRGLARDADFFATITEDEGRAGAQAAAAAGLASTPSGAAGLAGLLAAGAQRETLGLGAGAKVLLILSESAGA